MNKVVNFLIDIYIEAIIEKLKDVFGKVKVQQTEVKNTMSNCQYA